MHAWHTLICPASYPENFRTLESPFFYCKYSRSSFLGKKFKLMFVENNIKILTIVSNIETERMTDSF